MPYFPTPVVFSNAYQLNSPPTHQKHVKLIRRPLRALATGWAGDDATYALKPEGADPQLEGHGLVDGKPFGGEMFPVA